MLVKNTYTPDVTHDVLADVVPASNEVAAVASPNNGYTASGKVLTGQSYVSSDSPAQSVFDADDLTWAALTATFRYGIFYANKSVGSPAIVNPLIGYILFDNTPADKVLSAVDFLVIWSAYGIFDLAISS